MGTSLENVKEDIESLISHLKYFSECKGVHSEKVQIEINIYARLLNSFADIIQQSDNG